MGIYVLFIAFLFKTVVNKCKLSDFFHLKSLFINFQQTFTTPPKSTPWTLYEPFLSWLLRCCYSLLSIKHNMSDDLHIKMLFIDFRGSLKETCVQQSPCI